MLVRINISLSLTKSQWFSFSTERCRTILNCSMILEYFSRERLQPLSVIGYYHYFPFRFEQFCIKFNNIWSKDLNTIYLTLSDLDCVTRSTLRELCMTCVHDLYDTCISFVWHAHLELSPRGTDVPWPSCSRPWPRPYCLPQRMASDPKRQQTSNITIPTITIPYQETQEGVQYHQESVAVTTAWLPYLHSW